MQPEVDLTGFFGAMLQLPSHVHLLNQDIVLHKKICPIQSIEEAFVIKWERPKLGYIYAHLHENIRINKFY